METLIGIILIGVCVAFLLSPAGQKAMADTNKAHAAARETQIRQQAKLVCPHCGESGCVTTTETKKKQGISGGKATAAVFTGGLSLAATGLSRKNKVLVRSCSSCGSTWTVA